MRTPVLALAAAVAATSAPAWAQQPAAADRADVRCLLVLEAVRRDPKQKEAADRGVYYYLGKLEARGGVARTDAVMVSEAKALSPQQAQAELARCAAELNRAAQNLRAANQRFANTVRPPAKK